jgi:hypothetical protein
MRNLVEKAVPIVLASTPTLMQRDRWARQGETMVRQEVAETDWSITAIRVWSRIEALPEYQGVLHAIEEEPSLASQMNTLVGGPTMAMRIEPNIMVRSILGRVLKGGQRQISLEEFNTAYADVVDGLASPTIDHSVVAPLMGFDSEFDRVPLSSSIGLRRMTEDEIGRTIDLGLVVSSFGPGRPVFHPPTFAIEFTRVVSKRVGDASADPEEATRLQQEADDGVIDALSVLRLFKAGNLDIAGHFESSSLYFLRGGGSFRSRERRRPTGQPTYRLRMAELEELQSFYKACDSKYVKQSKGLAMAIRRFGFSAERSRADDQIVDLMIAAEALFLEGSDNPQRGEQRYRMSLRAAAFTPTDVWTRRQLFSLYRTAYDARSIVAHGSIVEKCKLPDGKEISLPGFVVAVQEQLRRAIKRAVVQSATARKRFSVDWEGLLLMALDS